MTTNSDVELKIPHVDIKIDGSSVPIEVQDNLFRVTVDSTLELPDMCEITIRDEDLQWIDGNLFNVGKALVLDYELDDSFTKVFDGEIVAIEPLFADDFIAYLVIRAFDKSHRLNRGTASKVWANSTDSDVVKAVAGNASLSIKGSFGITRDHIFQHNQSNLAFVHQLARLNGKEIYIDGTTLNFIDAGSKRGQSEFTWGDNLVSFNPRMSVAGQVNEVQVKGWDPSKKEAIIGKAKSAKGHPGINVGGSGGDVAKKAIGDAVLVEVQRPVASQKQANDVAQSILNEINASFVEAFGITEGDPTVVAGSEIKLKGLGDKFSGTYIVSAAHHIYEPGSPYTVEVQVSGSRPPTMIDLVSSAKIQASDDDSWGGVVTGIVTQNEDPDKLGRVKVKFPWIDDKLEGTWARVMMVGAGPERGIQFIPEINDEVVVAFGHGDFNVPYILGGLHNGKDKVPDTQAVKSGKVEKRVIKTRNGALMSFDDTKGKEKIEVWSFDEKLKIIMDSKAKSITVDNAAGDVIINSKGKTTVTADKDIELTTKANFKVDAKGNIQMKATGNITIQSTGNTEIKATGNITTQATGMMTHKSTGPGTVQSSANLTVKGLVTMIN